MSGCIKWYYEKQIMEIKLKIKRAYSFSLDNQRTLDEVIFV